MGSPNCVKGQHPSENQKAVLSFLENAFQEGNEQPPSKIIIIKQVSNLEKDYISSVRVILNLKNFNQNVVYLHLKWTV